MTQLKLKGPQVGSDLGTVAAIVAGASGSTTVSSYIKPAPISALPRLSDGFDGDTLTIDETGLTNVTGRQWMSGGVDIAGQTGATCDSTGRGGEYISVRVISDEGVLTSPAVRVYETAMMGMAMPAGHRKDDAAVLTIVPQPEATHIAVADGAWTDPATWVPASVPKYGAFPLIPHGRTVTYDNAVANLRLDRVRVDGTLNWALDQDTEMLVETIVGTRGSTITIGTDGANRVPSQYAANIVISGKNYDALSYTPTNLKSTRFLDARGWERGFIVQGTHRIWGDKKLTWSKADPIDQGATSLTLHDAPTGWSVGDTIVIGGTDIDFDSVGLLMEDEEREITGISGNVISWDDPLVYPHKNQLSTSTRTDLYPNIMAKGNKNVTIRSEVTSPSWRRGHYVQMHHHSLADLWQANFIDLGRTDKEIVSGVIDENGDYEYPQNLDAPTLTDTLTPEANLQSRYSLHFHHVGFNHTGERPIAADCYVEGSPGWAVVHHACDIDLQKIAVYKFLGAGIVSEQGNEVGAWIDCLVMHTTKVTGSTPFTPPKVRSGALGLNGDTFRHGYAYGFRGRAMRTNRCVANSCAWGNVYFPRTNGEEKIVQPTLSPSRLTVDLKDAGMIVLGGAYRKDEWSVVDYPIIHSADNEAVACIGGFSVTKTASGQGHDVNIRLKRLKCWGYRWVGADFEYIGSYLLDQFDLVSGEHGRTSSTGIAPSINTQQFGFVGLRVEGGDSAMRVGYGFQNGLYSINDPRFYTIGWDLVDVARLREVTVTDVPGPADEDVTLDVEDPYNTYIDYDLDPSESYPLVLAIFTDGGDWDWKAGNSDGSKTDNISSVGKLMPKPWGSGLLAEGEEITDVGDSMFIGKASAYTTIRIAQTKIGKYTYNGLDAIVFTDLISDRTTARPHKVTKLITANQDTAITGSVNNGAFVLAANPVSVDDITAVVAKGGSVVIDVPTASNASGGDGSTYTLDDRDYIACDHGTAPPNAGTGELTFTPDRDFTGTDEMFVFVKSGHRFGTVRINFLVTEDGTDAGITTPVVDTHFAAADHADADTIGIQCFDPPDTSERGIKRVDYSTDGGSTWRRLSNNWVQAVHKITVESDGTAISAGSYNVRLRYLTYYDFVTSTASGDDAVTVS